MTSPHAISEPPRVALDASAPIARVRDAVRALVEDTPGLDYEGFRDDLQGIPRVLVSSRTPRS